MNLATATPALLIAFAVAIGGQVLYHVAQKQVAGDAHPVLSVMAMYVVAFVACLPLLFFFPLQQSLLVSVKSMNWAVIAAGIAIVGIEVGFLLTYRLGAQLATTAVISSSIVALTLFLIGVAAFHEGFSWTKAAGGLLCIAGVTLISMAKPS
jgi:drug/metabolite transporter (DMT)-like permease